MPKIQHQIYSFPLTRQGWQHLSWACFHQNSSPCSQLSKAQCARAERSCRKTAIWWRGRKNQLKTEWLHHMEKIIQLGSVGRSKPYYNNCVAKWCCRLVFLLMASALIKNSFPHNMAQSPQQDHTVPPSDLWEYQASTKMSTAWTEHGDRSIAPPYHLAYPSIPSLNTKTLG